MITALITLASIASWVYIVAVVATVYNSLERKSIERQYESAMTGKW